MYFDDKIFISVSWELTSDQIEIGKSIILTCTVHNIQKIDLNVTRQWSIGTDSDIISYNGRHHNPSKYEEILSEENNFSLKIKNVTHKDLHSEYECRYKFDIYKKSLSAEERKVICKYSLHIDFKCN